MEDQFRVLSCPLPAASTLLAANSLPTDSAVTVACSSPPASSIIGASSFPHSLPSGTCSAPSENSLFPSLPNSTTSPPSLPTSTRLRNCTKCGLPSKGHQGPCGLKCQNPEPETLRSNDLSEDDSPLPSLLKSREELVEQDEEDEDDYPCPHCGALMSFEYLYFPDTGMFSGTCTKCSGAPAPRTPS